MTAPADRLSAALSSRYRIERELGQGGMATVYLAEDLKHDRKVAIKVLKPELAAVLGAERFVVEIKTTAAMSHPHILPLFDSGTADGFLFYVMPYIQGETIREKLNRETRFGVDEAVRIAREVADALDYAHRHGVIHRDIKPENILLHDGRAMVMDFGIALAVSAAAGGRMTETGLSLGTPHYMSPEQATAEKEITARSDQYSLASVLYEMLAGDPPFVASAAQAVIMKIIAETAAPVTKMRKSVPMNVAAALAQALQKVPADRFETARAFADALGNPAFTAGTSTQYGAAGSARARSRDPIFLATAAVALFMTLAAIGMLVSRAPAAPETPVIRTAFDVGPGATLRDVGGAVAITRDGSRVAYVTRDSSGTHALIRRADELVGRAVVDREVHSLAFSHDGRWLAFGDGTKIMKVSVDGGPAVQVADMSGLSRFARGLTWTGRGDIIVGRTSGAYIVSGAGGTLRPAFTVPDTVPNALSPIALPDPDAIAYTAGGSFESSRLAFASLATGKVEITDIPCAQVLGVLDARLIYVTLDGALMALPFDVKRSRPTGEPEPLGIEVRTGANFSAVAALSASGTLLLNRGIAGQKILLVSPTGSGTPLFGEVRGFRSSRFSPDGRRVALGASNAGGTEIRDVWVYDIAARTFSRLTSVGTTMPGPVWMPDGKRVVFLKGLAGPKTQIMSVPSDGSGPPEVMATLSGRITDVHVSPDAKRLIYSNGAEIVSRGLAPDTNSVVLVSGQGTLRDARTSPDGRWLAYNSDETGQQQIYVRSANGSGAKIQVSDGVGFYPVWSRSGRSLYFRNPTQVIEVPVTPGPVFAVGMPRVVLRGEYQTPFDVAPDGRAFVMVGAADAIGSPVIIHNWGRELREKLTAGRP